MKFFGVISLFLTIINSCSFWDNNEEQESFQAQFIEFNGSETKLLSGLLGDSIKTTFSYSFKISNQEVTQGEFFKYMGFLPIPKSYPKLINENYPIVFVTYFDMILYCNNVSKAFGFDTVYSYTSLVSDSIGQTKAIKDLLIDYSKNGYRLPTEAEWEYSARNGTNGFKFPWGNDSSEASNFAWYSFNSQSNLHTVCNKQRTSSHFCDLAGNVLEMVEDFNASYRNIDSVHNFIGSANTSEYTPRTVKGGSFASDIHSLATANKKDVYTVYSSTLNSYLGFRISQGAIPNPQKYTPNGLSTESLSPIKMSTTSTQVYNFFGTSDIKIAMVNGISGNLVSFDISNKSTSATEWLNVQAKQPMISPDGNFLIWGDVSEGQSKSGNIYLSRINDPYTFSTVATAGAIPRFYINQQSDTLIIFSSTAGPNTDSLQWSKEKSYSLQLCGSSICNATPNTWFANGAFHGGISSDHKFAITSYQDLRILNLQNDRLTKEFISPKNGKSALASDQACNASIGGDSNWVLFLDFGSTEKSTIIGKSYGIHEYLLLMDPATGIIKDTVKVPSPWKGWNHVEWSTNKRFAIATVTDASEQNRAVYAIRFPDHAILKFAEGEDILTPHLWVNDSKYSSDNISDSIFEYSFPSNDLNLSFSIIFLESLLKRESINTLAIGSSRTRSGINNTLFTSTDSAFSIASSGFDFNSGIYLLSNYSHLFSNLHTVLIEFSYDFAILDTSTFAANTVLNSIGFAYDKEHLFWPNNLNTAQNFILKERFESHPQRSINITNNGYFPNISQNWGENPPEIHIRPDEKLNHWKGNLLRFKTLLNQLQLNGYRVIIYTTPQSPYYRQHNVVGRYGVPLALGYEIRDSLLSIIKPFKQTVYLDEHQFGLHNYDNSMAYDYDHLSELGAERFTNKLNAILDTLKFSIP